MVMVFVIQACNKIGHCEEYKVHCCMVMVFVIQACNKIGHCEEYKVHCYMVMVFVIQVYKHNKKSWEVACHAKLSGSVFEFSLF